MYVIINEEKCTVEIDNEAKKAIRFCLGLNLNLRIKLNKQTLRYIMAFLRENDIGIYGQKINIIKIRDYNKYLCLLTITARKIMN